MKISDKAIEVIREWYRDYERIEAELALWDGREKYLCDKLDEVEAENKRLTAKVDERGERMQQLYVTALLVPVTDRYKKEMESWFDENGNAK